MKFNLHLGYLQHNIIFVIDGLDYKATARMVVMDRSKPNKLEKEEHDPELCTFQWNAFNETCEDALQVSDAVEAVQDSKNNDLRSVIFTY